MTTSSGVRHLGEAAETFSYADVNADHAIDASDYVLWRKATSPNSAAAAVPEPKADALAAIAVMLVTVCQLGRPR